MLNLCKRTHPVFQLTRQNLKSGYFYFISCIIHANSCAVDPPLSAPYRAISSHETFKLSDSKVTKRDLEINS